MKHEDDPESAESRPPPKKLINISIRDNSDKVKLHRTANAWKPFAQRKKSKSDRETEEREELFRKVRGILNKLTPQNFQKLVTQVLDLGINTEEKLAGTIDITFEKAISEPNFSVTYANLCKCLNNVKVPQKQNPEQYVMFRKLLLNRCQKEFERDKADALDLEKLPKEIGEAKTEEEQKELKALKNEAKTKAITRSLGNIRFIGELFKLRMVTENIIHDCLLKLLRSQDEDSLEALCILLKTIGKDLDVEGAKPKVDQYFMAISKMVTAKKHSYPLRFMMLDIMDLRKNNWVPRRQDNLTPKTIKQIHREAQEEKEQQKWKQNRKQKRNSFLEARIGNEFIVLLDKYLHDRDLENILHRMSEKTPGMGDICVSYMLIIYVLEQSEVERKLTSQLLCKAIERDVISTDDYSKGLTAVLEYAGENDIPPIWKYLGELVGPMMEQGVWHISNLKQACKVLLPSKKAGVLVAHVLHNAAEGQGHIKVGEMWKASSLKWSDFLGTENQEEFLAKHKLEYTVEAEVPKSPEATTMPVDLIQKELEVLIIEREADNEVVFDWINANVAESHTREAMFIRALMTAVCTSAIVGQGSSCKVEAERLKKRCILLQRYLDHDAKLELQALYALQALVHKLGHPPEVLRVFFDNLYDENIISEDAFYQWESSKDPAEVGGRCMAVSSVGQFFTWLREEEEDDYHTASE